MQAHANLPSVHVAAANDEPSVDLGFFGFADLGFDWVRAEVGFGAELVRVQFAVNFLRIAVFRG